MKLNLKLLLPLLTLGLMANNDLPPVKYQINAPPTVLVVVRDASVDTPCGKAPPGWVTEGCETDQKVKGGKVGVVFTANPCNYPEAADDSSYAHLLCHELGHVNGWNADHNN